MEKEIVIVLSDEHLRSEQTKIIAAFGAVKFDDESITIERAGYNKEFLNFSLCCADITGAFSINRTWITIPVSKIINIVVK